MKCYDLVKYSFLQLFEDFKEKKFLNILDLTGNSINYQKIYNQSEQKLDINFLYLDKNKNNN